MLGPETLNQQQSIQPDLAEFAPQSAVDRLAAACKRIDRQSIVELFSLYADDVYYEDSFKALQGKKAFLAYCTAFLEQRAASIRIITSIQDEDSFFISWSASISDENGMGTGSRVEGASYFKLRGGLIYFQRNYFDLGKDDKHIRKARRTGWIKSRSGQ